MSYTRTYRETLSGSIRVSVDYPASESGGSISATGDWEEDVSIHIEVDTEAFDQSVAGARTSVEMLSGAVVATGVANAASKLKAGERVSGAILAGFFKSIGFEIKQQLIELTAFLGPKFEELAALEGRCRAVQTQMEQDYRRISDRYTRLFQELDQELRRRILELDRPSFGLAASVSDGFGQPGIAGQMGVPAVTAGERDEAQAVLLLGAVKRNASVMIEGMHGLITRDRDTARQFGSALQRTSVEGRALRFLPVLMVVRDGTDGSDPEHALFRPGEGFLAAPERWQALGDDGQGWAAPADLEPVKEVFRRRLSAAADGGGDGLEPRVLAQVQLLWDEWRAA